MDNRWTSEDARSLYSIDRWGAGYFSVNGKGHICVDPKGTGSSSIDVKQIVNDLRKRNIPFPVMIRFQDILRHRVKKLVSCFRNAIKEYGYLGQFQGVFPIKVNQLREVVEEIVDAGKAFQFGLEVGSKAELIAALCTNNNPGSLIICNGFKDHDYIRTALYGNKIGRRVILVVEKLTELDTILEVSEELGIHPEIGIRVKLYSKGAGRWEASSGDQAKFGLTTTDVMTAVKKLKTAGKLKSLVLTHFHLGSQITDIWKIKKAARESARVYAKLRKLKVKIEFMDVGGGLGVDYDGSRTNFHSSKNYSMQEYANDIVYSILEVCNAEDVPHPSIICESGRSLTAHHAVLVVPVLDMAPVGGSELVNLKTPKRPTRDAQVIQELTDTYNNVSNKNALEAYHDASSYKEEAFNLFNLGFLSLQDRAKAEQLYWKICEKVIKKSSGRKFVPEEIKDLEVTLADKYYCSFSIFQSCPDFWAIDHLFPIAPIHRLNEKPKRKGILVDITCDSDGKMDQFVDIHDIKHTLPLHEMKAGDDYHIGIFMVGAYQDAMGDLHNLFGRVNEVHVFIDPEEGYYIEKIIEGDTASDVLEKVQYMETELKNDLNEILEERVEEDEITYKERQEVMEHFTKAFQDYTYINPHPTGSAEA